MPIKYKDYYEILGVSRNVSQDDLRKAYHKLARKYHPDVNKGKDAEPRFKEIAEAYEVLGDVEKRRKYDELGSSWQSGQEFRPPPGWENVQFEFRGNPEEAGGFSGEPGGFSDFFEALFGGAPGGQRGGYGHRMHFDEDDFDARQPRGEDQEATINISLEDSDKGGKKSISLQRVEQDERGRPRRRTRTYDVRIPPGVGEGARIRLAGQGGAGYGEAGDLYLRIHLDPHPFFRVKDHDLECDLKISPWKAALGGKAMVRTLSGHASLNITAGTQSGQRLRLRGKGLGGKGDLYAVVQIFVPAHLTQKEKSLFEELSRQSAFKPEEEE